MVLSLPYDFSFRVSDCTQATPARVTAPPSKVSGEGSSPRIIQPNKTEKTGIAYTALITVVIGSFTSTQDQIV